MLLWREIGVHPEGWADTLALDDPISRELYSKQ
jgi:hypothetical protein